MSLRLFVSSTSGSMKIKEQQAYMKRILDSLGLKYEEIDISDPKNAEAKAEMQEAAKSHSKAVVPPHLLRDTNYIGDAQDFYDAVEDDNIEVYLQVPGAKEKKIAAAPDEKGGNDELNTEKSDKIDDQDKASEPADKNKDSDEPDKDSDGKEASAEEEKDNEADVKVKEAEAEKDKESDDKDKDSEEKDKDSEEKDKDSVEKDKETEQNEKEADEKDKESKVEIEEEPKAEAEKSAEPDDEGKEEEKKGESKADED